MNNNNINYEISKRDYSDDYFHSESKKIDMTLSGKYLSKYPSFSVNYNELGNYPSQEVLNEFQDVLRRINKINENNSILLGTGANGVLHNIIKVLYRNGGNLVTPFLSFNQPEYAVTAFGGNTKRVYLDDNGQISINNIINSIDKNDKMIYLCNPNNPTGMYLNEDLIMELASNVDQYVVVDESALEFSKEVSLCERELPDNLIVVKSLSKAYGLANLRLGYMICSDKFKDLYEKNITINEVSSVLCEYAIRVLLSGDYIKNIKTIIEERDYIVEELGKIGFEFFLSKSNILLSKTYIDDSFIKKLEMNDISVTKFIDQNKNIHFRIAVQDENTNRLFVEKFKEILATK